MEACLNDVVTARADDSVTPASKDTSNAWCHPGPAAFDFRSDVFTSPTSSMLEAIKNTTLLDDVYQADPTTNDLESHLAARTSHEAALFVLSGTMGNQIALRSQLQQPPYAILCDHRGHIFQWEAGGVASLCGALVKTVVPANGDYLTLEDIESSVVLGDEIHSTPTRVISLENTLGGIIMPLEETRRITNFARKNNIKVHLDGARLWEAVAAGAGSLTDYCVLFDSVSLCFSKGLGAPVGSILVGGEAFIKHARWVRKSIGGGLRQPGLLTAAARVALDETFGSGPWGEGGKLKGSHSIAKRITALWTSLGGQLLKKTETNMVWLDLEGSNINVETFVKIGAEHGVALEGSRLVVHYQIEDAAIEKLKAVFEQVLLEAHIKKATELEFGERFHGVT
ncbi:Aldolase vrtJ [Golovinomyces cichoracearum]|uniref:Aldolase vrtJ n=1 Tax=Golovinomyces cichoracearum TaxID=62708 RepID=A0A420JAG8_9PEZI|nr:Aldolase vrtJ [Golovinomyces cichoracearum]